MEKTLRRQSTPPSLPEHPRLVIFGSDIILPNDVVLTIAKRLQSLHSMSWLSRVNKHCCLAIRPFLKIVKRHCSFDSLSKPAWLIEQLLTHQAATYRTRSTESLFERPDVLGRTLNAAVHDLPTGHKKALEGFHEALRSIGRMPNGLDPARCMARLFDALEQLPEPYFNRCCEDAFSTISSPLMMKAWAHRFAKCEQSLQQRCMAAVLYACAPADKAATLFVEKTLDDMKRVTQMRRDSSPRDCTKLLTPFVGVLVCLPTRVLAFLTLILLKRARAYMPSHSASRVAVLTTLKPIDLRLQSERTSKLVGQVIGELNALKIDCMRRPRQTVTIIELVKSLLPSQHDESWRVLRSCMERCIGRLEPDDSRSLMKGLLQHCDSHVDDSALVALYECAAVIDRSHSVDPFGPDVRERLQAPSRGAATPALIHAITHWICQAAANKHFKFDESFLRYLYKAILTCDPVDQVALLDQVAAVVDAVTSAKKLDAEVAYDRLMAAAAGLTAVDHGLFMLCQLPRVYTSERKALPEAKRALGTGLQHWLGLVKNDPSAFDIVLDAIVQPGTRHSHQAAFCVAVLDAMSTAGYDNEAHRQAVENVATSLSWNTPSIRGFFVHLFNGLDELPDGMSVKMIDMMIRIFSGNASWQMIDRLAHALRSAPDLKHVPVAATLRAVEALVHAAFRLMPNERSVVTLRNGLDWLTAESGAIDPAYVERYIALFLQTDSRLSVEVLTALREWNKMAPEDAGQEFEQQFYVELFKKCSTSGGPDIDVGSALHDFDLKIWDADRTDEAATSVFSHLLKSDADDSVRPDSKRERKQKLAVLKQVMAFVEAQVDQGRMSIENFNVLVQRANAIWRACNDNIVARIPYHRRK